VHPKTPPPQGTRNVLIAIGKSLVGAIGGVLFMLGVLGVSMSVLLAVALVATKIQNLSMGISWIVAPASIAIFGVLGVIGYGMLRAIGMFTRAKR
jgi:chromate transport protein ChrA